MTCDFQPASRGDRRRHMCSLDAEHGQLPDYAALPGSGLPACLFQPHCALHHSAFAHAREIMAVEDAFASHAQATPKAISAPIGKSPDPAARGSGQEDATMKLPKVPGWVRDAWPNNFGVNGAGEIRIRDYANIDLREGLGCDEENPSAQLENKGGTLER